MSYRVELLDQDTEKSGGFLDKEQDENPNHGSVIREFGNLDDVREAISNTMGTEGLKWWYEVTDFDTHEYVGMVFIDADDAWNWDLPNDSD